MDRTRLTGVAIGVVAFAALIAGVWYVPIDAPADYDAAEQPEWASLWWEANADERRYTGKTAPDSAYYTGHVASYRVTLSSTNASYDWRGTLRYDADTRRVWTRHRYDGAIARDDATVTRYQTVNHTFDKIVYNSTAGYENRTDQQSTANSMRFDAENQTLYTQRHTAQNSVSTRVLPHAHYRKARLVDW